MPHVVLLGDSIFDNAAYVGSGPDVLTQLRSLLPAGTKATLCAVDGAAIADVERQLARLPADATHLVLSVGGNDALSSLGFLSRPARSVADVLDQLADIAAAFEGRYQRMLRQLLAQRLPVTLCTIYNGRLPDPDEQRRAQTALAVLNDVILRQAAKAGLAAIELRHVCSAPEDYANPIEPSVQGGAKIARAISDTLVHT